MTTSANITDEGLGRESARPHPSNTSTSSSSSVFWKTAATCVILAILLLNPIIFPFVFFTACILYVGLLSVVAAYSAAIALRDFLFPDEEGDNEGDLNVGSAGSGAVGKGKGKAVEVSVGRVEVRRRQGSDRNSMDGPSSSSSNVAGSSVSSFAFRCFPVPNIHAENVACFWLVSGQKGEGSNVEAELTDQFPLLGHPILGKLILSGPLFVFVSTRAAVFVFLTTMKWTAKRAFDVLPQTWRKFKLAYRRIHEIVQDWTPAIWKVVEPYVLTSARFLRTVIVSAYFKLKDQVLPELYAEVSGLIVWTGQISLRLANVALRLVQWWSSWVTSVLQWLSPRLQCGLVKLRAMERRLRPTLSRGFIKLVNFIKTLGVRVCRMWTAITRPVVKTGIAVKNLASNSTSRIVHLTARLGRSFAAFLYRQLVLLVQFATPYVLNATKRTAKALETAYDSVIKFLKSIPDTTFYVARFTFELGERLGLWHLLTILPGWVARSGRSLWEATFFGTRILVLIINKVRSIGTYLAIQIQQSVMRVIRPLYAAMYSTGLIIFQQCQHAAYEIYEQFVVPIPRVVSAMVIRTTEVVEALRVDMLRFLQLYWIWLQNLQAIARSLGAKVSMSMQSSQSSTTFKSD
ncbi:hypothetical protein HK102_007978 [Quaeritorhiza haematococci]|nr:hypothetical protein HK102_007978 [Quaeritorhiza haematococci]